MIPAQKIVFINQATGYLTIDIVNAFAGKFDEVVLITGSIRVQDTCLHPGIKIVQIARYNRGSNLKKAFSWIVASFQIFFLLRLRYNRYDKFFFTVPPTAYLMAPWLKGKNSILVFDLYPEALYASEFIKDGLLSRLWARRNRKVFLSAFKIYTLSNVMKSGIEHYAGDRDVIVIPNWSAFSHLQPIKKENNKILNREGLEGKFIVQYSGNIGKTHNIETLIAVAEYLRDDSGIIFQIIGRGAKSSKITHQINEKGLVNCLVLPFREDGELYESLCAADLAVIILDDRTPDISIPSKIYNIMAAGLPVMAIARSDSGIADLVVSHQLGKVFNKNDVAAMGHFIHELRNNTQQLGHFSSNSLKSCGLYTRENARLYLSTYMDEN